MILIGHTIVSDEVAEVYFACDLNRCHGACCVDGDAGAPLEASEIGEIEDVLDIIRDYMTESGWDTVEKHGVFDYDAEGNFVTPLINGRECAFVVYRNGIAACAIEQAWDEGKIAFRKPVSCHLYPVRISKFSDFEAVNYHQWHICQRAVVRGRREGIPMYVFLKEALVRKYGDDWYRELVKQAGKKK